MGVSPLDDVLDPGFLDGISALPIDEIRLRRRQASELEVDLSYLRRLVQGRLDILLDESRPSRGVYGARRRPSNSGMA